MSKNVLLLCTDNSGISIIAQAVLEKYLKDINVFSASLAKNKPIKIEVKKALQKDGSWSDTFTSKPLETLYAQKFDLAILLSEVSAKQTPDFGEETTLIQIDYEEPNYSSEITLDKFIKTIKMELIPITRDILEL